MKNEIEAVQSSIKSIEAATRNLSDAFTRHFGVLFPQSNDELNSVDADCNTCRHLQRLPFDRSVRPPSIWGMPGRCSLLNREVIALGNGQMVGASCWESRKTNAKSAHAPGSEFDGSQFCKGPHWGLK